MSKNLIFSRLGWILLIVSIIVISLISFFLPEIFSRVGLTIKEEWPAVAKIIFQLTIGSWCATFVASAGRVYVWFQALLAGIPPTDYEKLRDEVKIVQTLFVWILGLMTALSGYVALLLS
ncbi:MAG: hypothetical protein PVH12_07600 [Candidatus Bathyarchaeota archaeon]